MQRQLEPALRAFERAEQTSPDPAVTRVRAAQLLAAAGERDRAMAKAQASVASTNAAPLAYALLARLYLEKGSPELAERELQNGVKAAPQSWRPASSWRASTSPSAAPATRWRPCRKP